VTYAKDEDASQRSQDVQDHCEGQSEAAQSVSQTHSYQQVVKTETPFA